MCIHVCLCVEQLHMNVGVYTVQRHQISLELQLQLIMSLLIWVLGIKCGSSGRAVCTHNCWVQRKEKRKKASLRFTGKSPEYKPACSSDCSLELKMYFQKNGAGTMRFPHSSKGSTYSSNIPELVWGLDSYENCVICKLPHLLLKYVTAKESARH